MPDPTYNLSGGFKPTIKRFADLDGPDFFPTPRWATFALIDNEKFSGEIWECACGDGTMSKVLKETGCAVLSSDLYDRGYGEVGLDFLTSTRYADNIVTKHGRPSPSQATASPSSRHDRTLSVLADATISGSRSVQSWPLRVTYAHDPARSAAGSDSRHA